MSTSHVTFRCHCWNDTAANSLLLAVHNEQRESSWMVFARKLHLQIHFISSSGVTHWVGNWHVLIAVWFDSNYSKWSQSRSMQSYSTPVFIGLHLLTQHSMFKGQGFDKYNLLLYNWGFCRKDTWLSEQVVSKSTDVRNEAMVFTYNLV